MRLLLSVPFIPDRKQSSYSPVLLLHTTKKAFDKAQERQISSVVAQTVVPSEADLI